MSSSITQFKIIFLGDAGVGKSSLIHRYIMNEFLSKPEATLGSAFFCKTMIKNGEIIKLSIWDTSGEEKFRSVTPMYYKEAHAAILTYDLTNLGTLDGVEYYIKELENNGPENIIINMVGNKRDLVNLKDRENKDIEEFSKELNGVHVQTSALSGIGVDHLFDLIIDRLLEQSKNNGGEISEVKDTGVSLGFNEDQTSNGAKQKKIKKKGCC